ncbi:unnamed protein product [Cyprideis torosa]|uniref:alpha-glucosidase n=1 Tax=Cyprideis torosa TaxID=163714 RepID=A0A7R8ZVN0_9CRUS|nr:unnamed protein product [Cyprideis torosa]CAG0903653.1 unnamed protein product [Cyprideis torosa]
MQPTEDPNIFQLTVILNPYNEDLNQEKEWKLTEDVSHKPQFTSDQPIVDALFNLSLEEAIKNIEPDSTLRTGAKWGGVWTRDVSYSILLAFAYHEPEVAKISLRKKVKRDRIIQDTGSGGAWPVSSDRTTWVLAAWEIYKVTGDRDWLEEVYPIIKNTLDDDYLTIYDPQTGMFSGESSFLDWREQTYPKWMDNKDIYRSQNLGTNVVHYQAHRILSAMAKIKGEPHAVYDERAEKIKKGINDHLWMQDKGYYAQYLYGRSDLVKSARYEALGEALAILFEVADNEKATSIIGNSPLTTFGATCIYPQIPGIPPYHNNGIWPFVQSYWNWAAAKTGNEEVLIHGLASVYRAAGLFLTNYENMVAETDKATDKVTPKKEMSTWWKEGVLYQIYPQSFKDTDGDGFGDFRGVIEKLDYIQSLGVKMVWMNPFFDSPLVDNGYDVADYRAILPRYGTMDDFQEMLDGLHERDIKFILDVVVNHSSNEHEWFKQSRSSRDNPYRDYYHWWPAEKGQPPFRHSLFDPEGAWEYDSLTNAYYLHYFADAQPDLNWENPKVRQEVYDIMKFWVDKGVDGFRLDAFQFASKDTTFPEWPKGHERDFSKWYGMRPQLHDYLREMNEEVLSKYDVFAVAEGAGSSFKDAHDLVDEDRKELQMAYHFESVGLSRTTAGYELADFKETFSRWDSAFAQKGWIAVFLSNHDNSRLVNRFANTNPEFKTVSTQMIHTFLMSMRGTPYTYYGDEIGMTNIDMPTIEEYVDVSALGEYKAAVSQGLDLEEFMKELNYRSRENARTPMQWNATKNGGFSNGTPWKRVNENYSEINVSNQEKDPNSILNHFRKMTKLRNENSVLVYGKYTLLQKEHPSVYAYTRGSGDDKMLILLNFSDAPSSIHLDEVKTIQKIEINNYNECAIQGNTVNLLPYQAVIFRLGT